MEAVGPRSNQDQRRRYALAVAACALTTALTLPLLTWLDPPNIVVLFLLTVFFAALKLGRGPAVLSALLSVLLFDFFFVPPRFSLAVQDAQYLVTFAVMLAVGLATAELTVRLQLQADAALQGQQRTHHLYELARELAGAASLARVTEALAAYLAPGGSTARICLLDDQGNVIGPDGGGFAHHLARLAIETGEPVTTETITPDALPTVMLPLKAPVRTRGVMVVHLGQGGREDYRRDRDELITVASLVAIAVERLHYADVAQATEIQMTTERLRNSMLSALSHDLRTPLTALVGLADSLAIAAGRESTPLAEPAGAIRDLALRMSNLVANLLDMARLQAGKVTLRKEWQLFEDVVGASLNLMRPSLGTREVTVTLDGELPLVEFDAVLIERVLCNLIENAAKYSPEGAPLQLRGWVEGAHACLCVCDRGPGIAPQERERLFGMFERGSVESNKPGVGLGLAICRAIADAHGGRIAAEPREGGGTCVTLRLPLGNPPSVDEARGEDEIARAEEPK